MTNRVRRSVRLASLAAALALGSTVLSAGTSFAAPGVQPAAKPSAKPSVQPSTGNSTPTNEAPSWAAAKGPFSAAKAPVSAAVAKAHKLRPAHAVRKMTFEHATTAAVARGPKAHVSGEKLNANKFADNLHAALATTTRGYAMQLRKGGVPQVEVVWDWGRTPNDGSVGWTVDTRMHVASVSKLMTAIIMVDLLDERGISVDAKIGPYLPDYWTVGDNVADITFRDLMTHRTGFDVSDSDGSLPVMKREVAEDVPANPESSYENVNFSLCRVVGAVLDGWVPASAVWTAGINDAMWDITTLSWFITRANLKIYGPAGVDFVGASPSSTSSFAYSGKSDTQGWNSGDLTTQLGGAGFRMSVNDVLDVMGRYRRGHYVPQLKAGQSIGDLLGLDWTIDTPQGKGYTKNGAWGDSDAASGNWEQSVAYFLPEGIELVVLTNSQLAGGHSLSGTVTNVILNSYE